MRFTNVRNRRHFLPKPFFGRLKNPETTTIQDENSQATCTNQEIASTTHGKNTLSNKIEHTTLTDRQTSDHTHQHSSSYTNDSITCPIKISLKVLPPGRPLAFPKLNQTKSSWRATVLSWKKGTDGVRQTFPDRKDRQRSIPPGF